MNPLFSEGIAIEGDILEEAPLKEVILEENPLVSEGIAIEEVILEKLL